MSKIKISYGCQNTAYHTGVCCETCWNKHPEASKGDCFHITPRKAVIERELFIDGVMKMFPSHVGISREVVEFLYDNFQQK